MRRRGQRRKTQRLVVSHEAIEDFSKLSISDRLRWLDEARAFCASALPAKVRKAWINRSSAVPRKPSR